MVIERKFLTVNKYSRPGTKLDKVKKIVIHYVGNPGSSAIANRNYFESLKDGKKSGSGNYIYASSHYIIGLDGEIIQCIPENEMSYASNSANPYSISIECCHPDSTGKFNDKTMKSLKELCKRLCNDYKLNPIGDIIRHYDVTKKVCPKWFVDHEDEWIKFKKELVKVSIPQWKIDTAKVAKDKLGLDDTWMDKLEDTMTVADVLLLFERLIDKIEKAKMVM